MILFCALEHGAPDTIILFFLVVLYYEIRLGSYGVRDN